MALSEIQTLVYDLVRDDGGKLSDPERDRAIERAVARYSQDRPRQVVEDITSNGTAILPLPAAWVAGRSAVISLEYPVGTWPPTLLDAEFVGVANAPTGQEIRLVSAIASGQTVRATIRVPHVLSVTTDTLPTDDHEPVASYAAALLLEQLATLYASDGDSTIQADSVDHRSKADVYRSLARAARQRYFDALGIDPKRQQAAGVAVNLALPDSRGRDRLTHSSRYR